MDEQQLKKAKKLSFGGQKTTRRHGSLPTTEWVTAEDKTKQHTRARRKEFLRPDDEFTGKISRNKIKVDLSLICTSSGLFLPQHQPEWIESMLQLHSGLNWNLWFVVYNGASRLTQTLIHYLSNTELDEPWHWLPSNFLCVCLTSVSLHSKKIYCRRYCWYFSK